MLELRGVKVHDDTHRVLKRLKAQSRVRSLDEVIRGMIRSSTGRSVEQHLATERNIKITTYIQSGDTKQK
jgi:diphthamide synthase (EF-2-diphthine--ammonia ligase)